MTNAQKFWDKIAPRYAKSPIRDEASYQKKLAITQSYFQPDWTVLEFGCGTGSTAIVHAPHVKQILATDISGNMLAIAEDKVRQAGLENICFQEGTLESLDLHGESFDAVLGLNILHLLDDVEGTIGRVKNLLKPGGIFVSSTVLLSDVKLHWRLLIPLMELLGFAPKVNSFDKRTLLTMLVNGGFSIDHEWQAAKESIFLVAIKPL